MTQQIASLLEPGHHNTIVVDLAKVRHADASGLAHLVLSARKTAVTGGKLKLAAPPEHVSKLLVETRLHRVLSPYASVEAALEAA
jgi:anti-sigma B factor antagonist